MAARCAVRNKRDTDSHALGAPRAGMSYSGFWFVVGTFEVKVPTSGFARALALPPPTAADTRSVATPTPSRTPPPTDRVASSTTSALRTSPPTDTIDYAAAKQLRQVLSRQRRNQLDQEAKTGFIKFARAEDSEIVRAQEGR